MPWTLAPACLDVSHTSLFESTGCAPQSRSRDHEVIGHKLKMGIRKFTTKFQLQFCPRPPWPTYCFGRLKIIS